MTRPTERDYRSILKLSAELGELSLACERADHFLRGCQKLVGCEALGMVSARPAKGYFELGATVWSGLSESDTQRGRKWYIDAAAFRQDPMNEALWRHPGEVILRQQRIENDDWYRNPHVETWLALGLDDSIASVHSFNGSQVILGLRRSTGDRPFDQKSAALLECLNLNFGWLYRDLQEHGLLDPATPSLPPRLEGILKVLLRGLAEKEMAQQLQLSSRTVHKYVEQVYRFYQVKSRPELMALWIQS